MKKQKLEGRVLAFARGGDAIVETSAGRVYVPDVVPGDVIALETTERVRGALHGRALRVLEASHDRVAPPCAHVLACGGCAFMHASLERQRATKQKVVADALGHEVAFEHAGGPEGYRRRARLAFDARARHLGYRARRSNAVVDVASCLVLASELGALLPVLRERLLPRLAGKGELRLALGLGGLPVVRASADEAQPAGLYAQLDAMVREGLLAGASVLAGGATKPAVHGDPRERTRAFDGSELVGTDSGFSQANELVNARLVEHARAFAGTQGASVLELYAGHGNLTVALAPGARAYTAVELDPAAADALGANVRARGLAVTVQAKDAAHAKSARVDVVVLDPPRTGAADALPSVIAAAPLRIVYVSCDPITLGRDVRVLAGKGYALRRAVALDMFPHTPHVETVALLERV